MGCYWMWGGGGKLVRGENCDTCKQGVCRVGGTGVVPRRRTWEAKAVVGKKNMIFDRRKIISRDNNSRTVSKKCEYDIAGVA